MRRCAVLVAFTSTIVREVTLRRSEFDVLNLLDYGASLAVLAVTMLCGTLFAVAIGSSGDGSLRTEIDRVAFIERESAEETSIARNARLNELFDGYLNAHGGRPTAELARRFNALVNEHQLTNFDDFLAATTRPLVYVPDRASGDLVPVFGPLGSDVINPWLAAAGVAEGKPLDEQPMYHSATRALRENIDFAMIGVEDPNLSLDLLPPELRENARWAYARLNPTNKFNGGFDHPLFYCVVREAAEKLFRQDYPQAKLTMAELVMPVAEGGFGIASCLLCHEQNHNGVYRRLLGQGMYRAAKAHELQAAQERGAPIDEVPASVQAEADMFLLAAERVQRAFPDRIDVADVRRSLASHSPDNQERLKPGYDDFVTVLKQLRCLQCHSDKAEVNEELNPACHGAFVLHDNAYEKSENVRALCELVDFENIAQSRLLAKAAGRVDHEGAARVKLDEAHTETLRVALANWLQSFQGD